MAGLRHLIDREYRYYGDRIKCRLFAAIENWKGKLIVNMAQDWPVNIKANI